MDNANLRAGAREGCLGGAMAGLKDVMTESALLDRDALVAALNGRSIVLVGMMGAGKTSVGRRLAAHLHLPFVDADGEIEAGAQMTVPEIFERFGEPYFREGERKVLARLLSEGQKVLATGGGAFMNEATRARIAQSGVSIWLKPDFEVLMRRVRKRSNRPLLQTARSRRDLAPPVAGARPGLRVGRPDHRAARRAARFGRRGDRVGARRPSGG